MRFRSPLPYLGLLIVAACQPGPPQDGRTWYQVEYVYDGDTFFVRKHEPGTSHPKIKVRFVDIDTAEKREPKCQAERELAEKQRQALEKMMGRYVRLDFYGEDRFQRPLVKVFNTKGEDLSGRMMAEVGARAYSGGRRQSWC